MIAVGVVLYYIVGVGQEDAVLEHDKLRRRLYVVWGSGRTTSRCHSCQRLLRTEEFAEIRGYNYRQLYQVVLPAAGLEMRRGGFSLIFLTLLMV